LHSARIAKHYIFVNTNTLEKVVCLHRHYK